MSSTIRSDGIFLCEYWKGCEAVATNHLLELGCNYCDEHLVTEKPKHDEFHKITSTVVTSPEGFFGVAMMPR